jgi:hypothetical protein
MPKVTGTKIEKLENHLRKRKRVSTRALTKMFPDSQIASMIWHLEAKTGWKIEREKKGHKIVSYALTEIHLPPKRRTWQPVPEP